MMFFPKTPGIGRFAALSGSRKHSAVAARIGPSKHSTDARIGPSKNSTFALSGASKHAAVGLAGSRKNSTVAALAGSLKYAAVAALSIAGLSNVSLWAAEPLPVSEAEKQTFMTDQLHNVEPGAVLNYVFRKSGSLEKGYDDKVTLTVKAAESGHGKAVSAEFLTGEHRVELPGVGDVEGNPVTLYFLERDVREMQRITKGKSAYYRKRVRLAFAEAANIRPVRFTYAGHECQGNEISVEPYRDDPARSRFERFANKTYVFTLSDQVPGGVYSLRTIMRDKPDAAADTSAKAMLEETLTLAGHGSK